MQKLGLDVLDFAKVLGMKQLMLRLDILFDAVSDKTEPLGADIAHGFDPLRAEPGKRAQPGRLHIGKRLEDPFGFQWRGFGGRGGFAHLSDS